MNWLIPLGAAGLLYALSRRESRQLEKGRAYVAVFRLPQPIDSEKLAAVLPDGASIQPDGQNIIVTFNAPSSATVGDIPTPVGTIKLVSVKALGDVVSGYDQFGPAPTVFGGWVEKPGLGFQWSGWTSPKVMRWADANTALINSKLQFARAMRWDGSQWRKA